LLQVERNERFIFNDENVLTSKHPNPRAAEPLYHVVGRDLKDRARSRLNSRSMAAGEKRKALQTQYNPERQR
jgi:hypothetical protein